MRPVLLVCVAVVSAGCDKGSGSRPPAPGEQSKGKASPVSDQPFKERVAVYLGEVRSYAKLVESPAPARAEAKAAYQKVADDYSQVRDVPPEVDRAGRLAGQLKELHEQCGVADALVGNTGRPSPNTAKLIRITASEVEAALRR